jgi:hypothetical protein
VAQALDGALQSSLANLPALRSRSLILVDTSASMSSGGFSRRSTMSPVKAAAVSGVALAARGERVDLYGFADGVFRHDVPAGASVIAAVRIQPGRVRPYRVRRRHREPARVRRPGARDVPDDPADRGGP